MKCCSDESTENIRYRCEKHQTEMCAACLKCKDPELYCKFRPSCMIHFLEKEKNNANKE
jgi:hypothetical protein